LPINKSSEKLFLLDLLRQKEFFLSALPALTDAIVRQHSRRVNLPQKFFV